MAEEDKVIRSTEADTNQAPWFAFLSNFGIKFPPSKQESKSVTEAPTVDEEESEEFMPIMVKFPDRLQEFPTFKSEIEESEKGTDPRIMWQVYALGGFLILKWVLARWKERRSPKDEPSDGPSSAGND